MVNPLHALKETVSFIAIILFLIPFLTALGFMYYSISYLQSYVDLPYFAIPIYCLVPTPILLFWLKGTAAYIWYVILTGTITGSVILLFRFHGIPYFREFISRPFSYKRNALQELVELYSLVLFIDLIIVAVMYAFNYKPTNPIPENYPTYRLMLALLHASVYEEFLVRFLLLGVPVFLWRYSQRRIALVKIFGGGYKIGAPEMIFLLVSSTIFGIAHVPSWGWWKFLPTFIGGMVLGYLYLKYGLPVSILFHFASDFMNIPMIVDKTLQISFGLILFALIVAGLGFTISYSIRLFQWMGILKPKKSEKILPPPPPWIDVRCPNCGSINFIYLGNDEYQCLYCGTVFRAKKE